MRNMYGVVSYQVGKLSNEQSKTCPTSASEDNQKQPAVERGERVRFLKGVNVR
jgi:hypothetical protein